MSDRSGVETIADRLEQYVGVYEEQIENAKLSRALNGGKPRDDEPEAIGFMVFPEHDELLDALREAATELRALRETNKRLNRRCQLAEAAVETKVEQFEQRSKRGLRAFYFNMGKMAADAECRSMREVCICAAIQLPNGEVWRGHRHNDAMHTASKAPGVALEDIILAEQGFITSRNRFVSREEGVRLQREAGIVCADTGQLPRGQLYSEDLYLRDWRSPQLSPDRSPETPEGGK